MSSMRPLRVRHATEFPIFACACTIMLLLKLVLNQNSRRTTQLPSTKGFKLEDGSHFTRLMTYSQYASHDTTSAGSRSLYELCSHSKFCAEYSSANRESLWILPNLAWGVIRITKIGCGPYAGLPPQGPEIVTPHLCRGSDGEPSVYIHRLAAASKTAIMAKLR